MANETIYNAITKKVIDSINNGVIPWHKPWKNSNRLHGTPTNIFDKSGPREYNGINFLMLTFFTDYDQPYFGTFKQIKENGGFLKKGAKAEWVNYFPTSYKVVENGETKWIKKNDLDKYEEDEVQKVISLKAYKIYNICYIGGIDFSDMIEEVKTDAATGNFLDSIHQNMPNSPDFMIGGNKACYIPSQDLVKMPAADQFEDLTAYYSVLWHVLAHSTGAEHRLNRKMSGDKKSREYMEEEIVAELTASYLCAISGIDYTTENRSAAYLKEWSDKLVRYFGNNNRAIVNCAQRAQHATNYILGNAPEKVYEKAASLAATA